MMNSLLLVVMVVGCACGFADVDFDEIDELHGDRDWPQERDGAAASAAVAIRTNHNCVNVTPIAGACYTGYFHYYLREGLTVKINTYDNTSSNGTVSLEGFGRIPFACNTTFHKEDVAIDADLSCIPSDKLHFSIKYCEAGRRRSRSYNYIAVGLKIDRKGHQIWNATLYENKTCENDLVQPSLIESTDAFVAV